MGAAPRDALPDTGCTAARGLQSLFAGTADPERSQRLFQLLCKERQMQAARSLGPSCTTAEMPICATVQGHRGVISPADKGARFQHKTKLFLRTHSLFQPTTKDDSILQACQTAAELLLCPIPTATVPGHPSNTEAVWQTTLICARELCILNLLVEQGSAAQL